MRGFMLFSAAICALVGICLLGFAILVCAAWIIGVWMSVFHETEVILAFGLGAVNLAIAAALNSMTERHHPPDTF